MCDCNAAMKCEECLRLKKIHLTKVCILSLLEVSVKEEKFVRHLSPHLFEELLWLMMMMTMITISQGCDTPLPKPFTMRSVVFLSLSLLPAVYRFETSIHIYIYIYFVVNAPLTRCIDPSSEWLSVVVVNVAEIGIMSCSLWILIFTTDRNHMDDRVPVRAVAWK